jgi:hypothetical protein
VARDKRNAAIVIGLDSETDNPLIPVPGESKLKMEVDVTNKVLKTTCLIDPIYCQMVKNTESPAGCMDDNGDMIMVCITLGLKTNMNNLIHK